MSDIILSLRKFGAAYGERVVLSCVTFELADKGITVLLGPAGTGKSTLLRTLSGANNLSPSLRTWGEATYLGNPLDDSERPALVSQNATLMMSSVLENVINDLPERGDLNLSQKQHVARRLLHKAGLDELANRLNDNVIELSLGQQRHVAIARTAASNPRVLFIDEPTTGLDDDEDRAKLLHYIKKEGDRRPVIVVLHNQREARYLGGNTILLAGGHIQESLPTSKFFTECKSPAARDFVRSGSCSVPSPDAEPETLDEAVAVRPPKLPPEAREFVSDAFGPRNFLWLKRGVLAGTPRPGIVADLHHDLKALQRVGVTTLVSLTTKPVDPGELARYGIKGIWSPIKDMGAPDIDAAIKLCQEIDRLTRADEVVAIHCKAGLGRTGTILAAQLIWDGYSALDGLEMVRRIEPRWVQSEEQVNFLADFARELAEQRA